MLLFESKSRIGGFEERSERHIHDRAHLDGAHHGRLGRLRLQESELGVGHLAHRTPAGASRLARHESIFRQEHVEFVEIRESGRLEKEKTTRRAKKKT